MEHIKGYVWAIATVAAMISSMVTMFLVNAGLIAGVLLSLLALFVRSLRPAALYLLLMSFCGVLGSWGAFLKIFEAAGRHLEFDQIFQVMTIGVGASFTLGGLVGAGVGFLLARSLVRSLRRSTIRSTPPPLVGAPSGG